MPLGGFLAFQEETQTNVGVSLTIEETDFWSFFSEEASCQAP